MARGKYVQLGTVPTEFDDDQEPVACCPCGQPLAAGEHAYLVDDVHYCDEDCCETCIAESVNLDKAYAEALEKFNWTDTVPALTMVNLK